MKRLLSFSDDARSLQRFGEDAKNVRAFLDEHRLHGLELMRWEKPNDSAIPMDQVVGRHMPFWPAWLDFWRGDRPAVLRQFDNDENIEGYYFAKSLDDFMAQRREEVQETSAMRVQYAVFHVSHVEMEHGYTGRYTYTDVEVADAFICMINEMLKGIPADFDLLIENHWFPGFTFLSGELSRKLLDGIAYPKKGFVLDIGHLINTNMRLQTQKEAVSYILKILKSQKDLLPYVKAVHLNNPLPRIALENVVYNPADDYLKRLLSAMQYIGSIDRHQPFTDASVKAVIDAAGPEYLVYEFYAATHMELSKMVRAQNEALSL